MSFYIMEGERYRISTEEYINAERQLSDKFICFRTTMTWQEYTQYTEDLRTEASDYWYATSIEIDFPCDKPAQCEFGFMSDTDAMAFKLRWM